MSEKHTPEALRLAATFHISSRIGWRRAALETLRTQHALLERAWNNLDAATSYSRKSARDSHSKLLADLTAHLEPK